IDALRPGEPRTMLGYMNDDAERYQAFLDTIAPLRPVLRAGQAAIRRWGNRRGAGRLWTLSGHPLVIRAYFHYARTARGVQRVLEKTPGHIQHVHRLLQSYPRARLLYIHR